MTGLEPLTILQLTASGDTAGATRSVVELTLGLARRGHRVLLGARPESYIFRTLGEAGVRTFPIPFRRKLSLRDARNVARIAREEGVDVVNAHASKDRYAAALARLAYGMTSKVVITRRVMPSSGGGRLQGTFYKLGSDRMVAVSQAVAEALVGTGVPRGHITTIFNGLPPARIAAATPARDERLARSLDLPEGLPVLGIVSRRKDQDDVLRALPLLDTPVAVLFVGIKRAPDLALLERLVPAQHAVRYVDFAWDVLPYYALMDVSILPSRIEGLSQTLLESMALGLPTIASRAGGNVDILRHGANGLLYEPCDPRDLAAQIASLLASPELRSRLAGEGRRTALVEFSFERTLDATEALYRSLAGGAPRPAHLPEIAGSSERATERRA